MRVYAAGFLCDDVATVLDLSSSLSAWSRALDWRTPSHVA